MQETPVVTTPAPVVTPTDDDTRLRLKNLETLVSRYQSENESLKNTVQALSGSVQASQDTALLAQYERDLSHLTTLGIQLNLAEEMADCKDENGRPISQAAFKKLYHRIETKYPRGPVNADLGKVNGQQIVPNQALGIVDEDGITHDDVMAVVHYSESHPNVPWAECEKAVIEQKKAKKKTA